MSVRLSGALARRRIEVLRESLGELAYRRLLDICDALDQDHRAPLMAVHGIIGPAASENAKSRAVSSLRLGLSEAATAAKVDIELAAHGSTKLGAEARYVDFRASVAPAPQSPTVDVERIGDSLVTEQRATSRIVTVDYSVGHKVSERLVAHFDAPAAVIGIEIDNPWNLLPGETMDKHPSASAAVRILIVSTAYLAENPRCGEEPARLPTLVVMAEPLPQACDTAWMCRDRHVLFPTVISTLKSSEQAAAAGQILDIASSLLAYGAPGREEPTEGSGAHLWPHNPGVSTPDVDRLASVIEDAHASAQWSQAPGLTDPSPRGLPLQVALVDWLDDTDGKRLCAVLGESGVGKTINAQLFYKRAREDDGRGLVFYFDLRLSAGFPFAEFRVRQAELPGLRLADSLLELCMKSWRNNPYANLAELVAAAQDHSSLWIVDGLDEALTHLSNGEGRNLGRDLLALVRDLKQARMVLTCRDHYFESIASERAFFSEQHSGRTETTEYLAFRLLPFDADQIERYVRGALGDDAASRALETIRSVQSLEGLAARPFNLKLVLDHLPAISAQARAGGKFSTSWLYELITTDWLSRDDGKHQFQAADKLRLMEHLAWWTWSHGARGLAPERLHNWLGDLIGTDPRLGRRYSTSSAAEEMLQEDLRTATFLVRRDGDRGRSEYRFAHTSLHEFFLARHLILALTRDERAVWEVDVPSRETLDFILSLLDDAEEPHALTQRLGRWGQSYVERSSRLVLALASRSVDVGTAEIALPRFDFGGGNWRGLAIGGPTSRALSLRAANAAGADFRGARLCGVDVSHADFTCAQLDWARLGAVTATATDFAQVSAAGAILRECRLDSEAQTRLESAGAHLLFGVRSDPHHLDEGSLRRVIAANTGHQSSVRAVAFSPDGTRLATASTDGAVRVWDTTTWETLTTLQGHQSSVLAVAFSPDGTRLATASAGNTVRVWDTTTWQTLTTLQGHQGTVLAVAFSPDGTRLATASDDKAVRVWDTTTWQTLTTLQGHQSSVLAIAFSPDGTRLATASAGNTVRVWDTTTWETLTTLQGHQSSVRAVTFSPNGTRLATASDDNNVRVWDTTTWETLTTLQGHQSSVLAVAFSPDGTRLATGSTDSTVRVWDTTTWETLTTLQGHQSSVLAVTFSPNGTRLATASTDGAVRVWDTTTWETLTTLQGHQSSVLAAAFSPDGTRLATGSTDSNVRVWDTTTWETLTTLQGHQSTVLAVAFSPDSTRLATASNDNTVRVWDTTTWETLTTLQSHQGTVSAAAFSPNGTRLATASPGNTVRVWDTTTWQTLTTLHGHQGTVLAVTFSPDGARLATGSTGNTVRVWDTTTWHTLTTLQGHRSSVLAVTFSPDGTRLATASADNTVRVWDTTTWETLTTLQSHQGTVSAAAFSPNGTRLATASPGNTVRVWDTTTWQTLTTLHGHQGTVLAVTFSPDGARLATGSTGNTVRVWDTTTWHTLTTLQGHQGTVLAVTFSPNGTRLATASNDNTVRVWDTTTARAPHLLFGSPSGGASWKDGSADFIWRSGDTSEHLWIRLYEKATGALVEQGPAEQYLGTPSA